MICDFVPATGLTAWQLYGCQAVWMDSTPICDYWLLLLLLLLLLPPPPPPPPLRSNISSNYSSKDIYFNLPFYIGLKLRFNIILPLTPTSRKWSFPFWFSGEDCIFIFHLLHACYMSPLCISSWFDWWSVQIILPSWVQILCYYHAYTSTELLEEVGAHTSVPGVITPTLLLGDSIQKLVSLDSAFTRTTCLLCYKQTWNLFCYINITWSSGYSPWVS
jgi:hypothetical protein